MTCSWQVSLPFFFFISLCWFVCFVRSNEGHAVSSEVCIKISRFAKVTSTHLTGVLTFPILHLCSPYTRGWPRGPCCNCRVGGHRIWTSDRRHDRSMIGGGISHTMADEEMPAERGGGCETCPALLTLKPTAPFTVTDNMLEKLLSVLCGKTTWHAAEPCDFLLLNCSPSARPGQAALSQSAFCFNWGSAPKCGRTTIMLRWAVSCICDSRNYLKVRETGSRLLSMSFTVGKLFSYLIKLENVWLYLWQIECFITDSF